MNKRTALLMLFFFSLSAMKGWAASLSLNYSEVLVENLQPGVAYSMARVVNLPVQLTNKYDEPIKIQLQIASPDPKAVKKGFEPVPNVGWVELEKNILAVPAHQTASSDLTITIPDDDAYLGKKYQVNINANVLQNKPIGPSYSFSLIGRLLITVAPGREKVDLSSADVNFDFVVFPDRVDMIDVPLGKKMPVLTADGKPIIVKNQEKKKRNFSLELVDPSKSILSIELGFEATPNPNFMLLPEEKFTLAGQKEKLLQLYIEIPDQEKYFGRKFFFVFAVTTGSGEVTQGKRYIRVLVSTKKDERKTINEQNR